MMIRRVSGGIFARLGRGILKSQAGVVEVVGEVGSRKRWQWVGAD